MLIHMVYWQFHLRTVSESIPHQEQPEDVLLTFIPKKILICGMTDVPVPLLPLVELTKMYAILHTDTDFSPVVLV